MVCFKNAVINVPVLITLTDNLVKLSIIMHIIQCQELIVIELTCGNNH